MAIGVFALPYIYHQAGTVRLGILTIIWSLIGYFSIFDFGLGRALTQRIALEKARNNRLAVKAIARYGVIVTSLVGAVGSLLVFTVFNFFGLRWLNVPASLQTEVRTSFLLAAIAIPVTTATSGLRGVLEGESLFKMTGLLKFALGVCNFGGPVIAIYFYRPSLGYIVASLVIGRVVVLVGHLWAVSSTIGRFFSVADKASTRGLFHFGGWMTLSNVISPLMVVADRFFIAAILGTAWVAYYTVPAEFMMRLLIIPAAYTSSLFPVLSGAMAGGSAQVEKVYSRAKKVVAVIMLPVVFLIAVSASVWLRVWLGGGFPEKSSALVQLLAVGIFFNSLAQVPYTLIQASGDSKTTALIHLLESVIYVPVLLLSLKAYGVAGAAATWSMRACIDLILLAFAAKRITMRMGRANAK